MEDLNTGGLARPPLPARALLTLAGALLAVLWLASMSMVDGHACSAAPFCLGLAAVVLLGVLAVVLGARPARPTAVCLLGLAAGLYFAARCAATEYPVEAWGEGALLLGAFVFYGAGYLAAQRKGAVNAVLVVLAIGVLANILYLHLLRDPSIPQEITGRPETALTGKNSRGATLFVYKNHAGAFLVIAGGVLLCRALWAGWRSFGGLVCALAGLAGIACSFFCGTRAVFLLLPVLAVAGWLHWFVIRLYSSKGVGLGATLTGVALLIGLVAMVGDLLMGHKLMGDILSIDTHLRTDIWECALRAAANAPWCGYGSCAMQWQILPFYNELAAPNLAHNEYVQCLADYGFAGLLLMLLVIGGHLSAGFWALASDETPAERRVFVSACSLALLSLAAVSIADFMWHSFALVTLTAFACGVLASPVPKRRRPLFSRRQWASGSLPPIQPVRPMGLSLCALACVGALALAAGCGWLGWRLTPAWEAQWRYNELCHDPAATPAQKRDFLAGVLPGYPDSGIVDNYVYLCYADQSWDWKKLEEQLRIALRANPRQLFCTTMLSDVLRHQGRHEEAESLLRDAYGPGGLKRTALENWPGHYALNLLAWGKQRLSEGDHGSALSMMEFALNMQEHGCVLGPATRWRGGEKPWKAFNEIRSNRDFLASCQVDVDTLRALGVEKDDSWKQPLRPGGPGALYQEWGSQRSKKAHSDAYRRKPRPKPKKK